MKTIKLVIWAFLLVLQLWKLATMLRGNATPGWADVMMQILDIVKSVLDIISLLFSV